MLASGTPAVSVIVPLRNEAGTIADLVRRLPEIPGGFEVVMVEGGSSDDTLATAQAVRDAHPHLSILVLAQPGRGKADAVRFALDHVRGRFVIILDGDLGVDPERIPEFIAPLADGRCGLVNGVRVRARREAGAMPYLNSYANDGFAWIMSCAIGQRIGDALCGTKAFALDDWRRWTTWTSRWRHLDPFGDFEILCGAAWLDLKIRDIPVDYRARRYGSTNISRFRDGFRLMRAAAAAGWELHHGQRRKK
jgi:glycosyltransferase involved in cell wall biosynthesis